MIQARMPNSKLIWVSALPILLPTTIPEVSIPAKPVQSADDADCDFRDAGAYADKDQADEEFREAEVIGNVKSTLDEELCTNPEADQPYGKKQDFFDHNHFRGI